MGNEETQNKYDIIICGAGLAGLSLVYRAFSSGIWKNERVLVIDQTKKDRNDRTWSFWEQSPGVFEELVYHRWDQLFFFTHEGKQINLDHLPYTYKTIKSIDFYNHIRSYLSILPQVEWCIGSIESVESVKDYCQVKTSEALYECKFAFNSLYVKPELKSNEQYFLQHFKGVTIRTGDRNFDPDQALLMDFRTAQDQGTTFFYTLPMKENEVFVEYTLFSKALLPTEVYDKKIKEYLQNILGITNYEVLDSEYGVIPMTDYPFKRREGNVINIGTLGGDTRGSTGYTFTNVQKTIEKVLNAYKVTGAPFFGQETLGLKEKIYDSTLLNVLNERKYEGYQLFADLFEGTDAKTVFSFLNGESSLVQELKVMKSLKTWPFLKSFLKVITRRFLS